MPIDPVLYTLFVLATAGYIFTPGPIVSLIVAETLQNSPRHGIATALGAQCAAIIYLFINFFGFASIAVFPTLVLDIIRYVGAGYLLFLAWHAFSRKPRIEGNIIDTASDIPVTVTASFYKAAFICFTSPKTILFFAAFFPQFVNEKLPIAPQLLILSGTFIIIGFGMDIGWAFAASKAKDFLTKKDKLSLANKISGVVLATGAVLLLFINN